MARAWRMEELVRGWALAGIAFSQGLLYCGALAEDSKEPPMFRGGGWMGVILAFSGILMGTLSARAQSEAAVAGAGQSGQPGDTYAWLEEVSSPRAMAWVKAENARTDTVLKAGPRYQANFEAALAAAEDPHRLPVPILTGDEIYNQWQDAKNPRGLLRKTSMAEYRSADPHWTTVIDFEALGKSEGVGWVSNGLNCLYPEDEYCMVELSEGGEDATTQREFDLKTGRFVDGGFVAAHSKQNVAWVDKDTLLIARDWGPGTMTNSGYPFVVKEWKRGTPLDRAKEVFRGQATDERGAEGIVLQDAQGHQVTMVRRGVTFFEAEYFLRTPRGMEKLAMPSRAEVSGLLEGRLLVRLHSDWAVGGHSLAQGSLLEMKLGEVMRDSAHLKPEPVFTPTTQEFLESAATTRDRLVVETLDHVQGRAYVYSPGAHGWTRQRLGLPENVTVTILTTGDLNNRFFLGIESFLRPPSIWLGDAIGGTVAETKTQPPLFDGSRDTVTQNEATSKDGTKIPYFVVHPKGHGDGRVAPDAADGVWRI